MTLNDLTTPCPITWCPGCGNFGTFAAFKNAAVSEGWDNNNTALVAGIGCHGNVLDFIKLTSFQALHGRSIPVATGIKLSNNNLNVFVFSGDGDGLGEGGNHLIHASRRNHDIAVFILNNGVYGLTTGQTSPTSPHGFKTKSTPEGNLDNPFNPTAIALASGATFVARGFSGDIPHLTNLMIAAQKHQGFAIIEILQPCVTFNKEFSFIYFKENCYKLDESFDKTNKEEAFKKTQEWGPKQIPIGIFYQRNLPSYESEIIQIKEKPLIQVDPAERNLSALYQKYS